MSQARATFLERMAGAYEAAQDPLLLDPPSAPAVVQQAARLLRNGLSVVTFAAFESFVVDRLQEVAAWLSTQNVPYSMFPKGLQDAPTTRAPMVLNARLRRDPTDPTLPIAFQELAESWSKRMGGGGWRLPHISLLWEGSNLSATTALEIASCFGVAEKWGDLTGVSKGADFKSLPSKSLFEELAERRHKSAHDASFDADILVLRSSPTSLTSFAFAFDSAVSSAARLIASGGTLRQGRAAVTLTTLDRSSTSANVWTETTGYWDIPGGYKSVGRRGEQAKVVIASKQRLAKPTDVLLVRSWDGTQHSVVDWETVGL